MKMKPSNSLNEAALKQLQNGITNESGDEEDMQNLKTAITVNNNSEIKRTKTLKETNQQNQQDLSMTQDNIKVENDRINFISEKDFKFEKNCWVCKILFGKINERQHHCRLCSHSVCKVCSGKKVNDNRVCDICFLKMKNVKGEKRKKKLLAAMKNFIKNLSTNISKGGDEYKKLEAKKQMLKDQAKKEDELRQNELEQLKAKLAQVQRSSKQHQDKNVAKENELTIKKADRQKKQDELNTIDMKLNNIKKEYALQDETYRSKESEIRELYKQKLELQMQESFLRLPNYERAKRNDPDNVCEALIFLDNNDSRNGINHYNTVSNNNVFQSITDSTGDKPTQNSTQRQQESNIKQDSGSKQEYASSYNQGLVNEDSDIVQHKTRSGKKNKNAGGKGTSCLCD